MRGSLVLGIRVMKKEFDHLEIYPNASKCFTRAQISFFFIISHLTFSNLNVSPSDLRAFSPSHAQFANLISYRLNFPSRNKHWFYRILLNAKSKQSMHAFHCNAHSKMVWFSSLRSRKNSFYEKLGVTT